MGYILLTASICYVLILEGLRDAPPLAFAGARTITGGAALIVFSFFFKRPIVPERRMWKWIPLVGLTSTTLTFGSMFLSPLFAGAGMASILGNAQPLFIALFAFLFLKESLNSSHTLALALGLAGVLFIVYPSFGTGENSLLVGSFLALGTSLAAAVATVLARWLKPGSSLVSFTAWQLLFGGILLWAASYTFSEDPILWTVRFVGILIFLGVLLSAVVTVAWFWLLQIEEAGSLGISLFFIPVLGVIWAFLFEGEIPGMNALVGGLLILIGMLCHEFEGFRWFRRLKK